MNLIPTSRIQQNLEVINNLPLPYELIQHIKTYCDDYLPIPIEKVGEHVDIFWINLGMETRNLRKWHIYCFNILQYSFGKTKYLSLWSIIKNFDILRSLLDDFVCESYPPYASIQINNKKVDITDIFYDGYNNKADIIEYPYKKQKKTISLQDKDYIIKCIERTKIYFNYLEKIDKFPVNVKKQDYSNNKIKQIKTQIKKIEKYCNKTSQIIN